MGGAPSSAKRATHAAVPDPADKPLKGHLTQQQQQQQVGGAERDSHAPRTPETRDAGGAPHGRTPGGAAGDAIGSGTTPTFVVPLGPESRILGGSSVSQRSSRNDGGRAGGNDGGNAAGWGRAGDGGTGAAAAGATSPGPGSRQDVSPLRPLARPPSLSRMSRMTSLVSEASSGVVGAAALPLLPPLSSPLPGALSGEPSSASVGAGGGTGQHAGLGAEADEGTRYGPTEALLGRRVIMSSMSDVLSVTSMELDSAAAGGYGIPSPHLLNPGGLGSRVPPGTTPSSWANGIGVGSSKSVGSAGGGTAGATGATGAEGEGGAGKVGGVMGEAAAMAVAASVAPLVERLLMLEGAVSTLQRALHCSEAARAADMQRVTALEGAVEALQWQQRQQQQQQETAEAAADRGSAALTAVGGVTNRTAALEQRMAALDASVAQVRVGEGGCRTGRGLARCSFWTCQTGRCGCAWPLEQRIAALHVSMTHVCAGKGGIRPGVLLRLHCAPLHCLHWTGWPLEYKPTLGFWMCYGH